MTTLSAARPAVADRTTPAVDVLYVAASAWLVGGLYWDGWAHGYGLPDSFWTVWHAAFYSGYAAVAAVLFSAIGRARSAGASWRDAVPAGYEHAVGGVAVFAAGGVFDAAWHTVFGVETSTDALLSPSHITLGLGIALIVAAPLRAAWRRGTRGGIAELFPAVLSLTALLSLFTFFTLFAGPYSTVLGSGARPTETTLVRTLLGTYLYSALVVGLALVALRRGTLPVGAMTVLIGLNGVAMILMRGHAPPQTQLTFGVVAFAAGLVADALLWRLRPSPARIVALRAFATLVPVTYFGLYLAVVVATAGTGWTPHALTGMVALAGVVGLLTSIVFTEGVTERA